jgi:hypothetical protein
MVKKVAEPHHVDASPDKIFNVAPVASQIFTQI